MSEYKPIVCLDFDGVIHSYTSGWIEADVVPDPPVPGAIEFIQGCLDEGMRVAIFSSRSNTERGRQAIKNYIAEHGRNLLKNLDEIEYPTEKPPALLTIDDRAVTFEGVFPDIE